MLPCCFAFVSYLRSVHLEVQQFTIITAGEDIEKGKLHKLGKLHALIILVQDKGADRKESVNMLERTSSSLTEALKSSSGVSVGLLLLSLIVDALLIHVDVCPAT